MAGFTLVEVIVALTILSLVVLATLTAVHTLGNTQARLKATIDRLDEMRLVSQFLRNSLRQAVPITSPLTGTPYFHGTAGTVHWAAPLQGVEGVAGLQYMRLYRTGDTLNIQFAPYQPDLDEPDWNASRGYPLLDGVEDFELSYRAGQAEGWQSGWGAASGGEESLTLPQAITIRVRTRGRYWPDLVVAPDQHQAGP